MSCCISSTRGQSTVEAAFLLPVFLLVLGLLAQPAIIFYDRCVMQSAAAETCRLVATGASDESSVKAFAQRRLKAIPSAAPFHMGDSWEIEIEGSELSGQISVVITNRCLRLPLVGVDAGLMGHLGQDGSVEFSATATCNATPEWVSALGSGPDEWISEWN